MKNVWLLFFAIVFCFPLNSIANIKVTYSGCDVKKQIVFKGSKSLLSVLQSNPIKCDYPFGTALMLKSEQAKQYELKEKIVNSLNRLIQLEQDLNSKSYLLNLKNRIEEQSVTGRVVGIELNPTLVEITPLANRLFNESFFLHVPRRANTINFVGAVNNSESYNYRLTLNELLEINPLLDMFQPGFVNLVHANSEIEKVKVGYWSHQEKFVSPGGWVIGLFKESYLKNIAENLNDDLAYWLATQVLP